MSSPYPSPPGMFIGGKYVNLSQGFSLHDDVRRATLGMSEEQVADIWREIRKELETYQSICTEIAQELHMERIYEWRGGAPSTLHTVKEAKST